MKLWYLPKKLQKSAEIATIINKQIWLVKKMPVRYNNRNISDVITSAMT